MNTTHNHRATGFGTDRLVAKYPWHVRSHDGRLLAGNNTEAGARDFKDTPGMATQAQLTATGQASTGSPAETGSGGQLNPAFSRWLMGLPSAWDDSRPTGTVSSRRKQKSSSKPCVAHLWGAS